jgi:hypothetical protein
MITFEWETVVVAAPSALMLSKAAGIFRPLVDWPEVDISALPGVAGDSVSTACACAKVVNMTEVIMIRVVVIFKEVCN